MLEFESMNLSSDEWQFISKHGYQAESQTTIENEVLKTVTTFEDGATVTTTIHNDTNASVVVDGITQVDAEKRVVYISRS